MKAGDLVRYLTVHRMILDWKDQEEYCATGLLIEFDKVQRWCIILDDETGELIQKHCSDVQLVKVGHADR